MPHEMIDKQIEGFEPWTRCKNCDATLYDGDWHLGGYRSALQPPCTPYKIDSKWKKIAELVPTNFGQSK